MPVVEDQRAIGLTGLVDEAPRIVQCAQRRPRKELERGLVAVVPGSGAQVGEWRDRFVDRSAITGVDEHTETMRFEYLGDAEDLVDRMGVARIRVGAR